MSESEIQKVLYYKMEMIQKMPSGAFKDMPIRMMQGQQQIQYLRKYAASPNFKNKRTYLKNAIYRKLNQYKTTKWDKFGVPNRKPKLPFNYYQKLFPETYE